MNPSLMSSIIGKGLVTFISYYFVFTHYHKEGIWNNTWVNERKAKEKKYSEKVELFI